MASPGIENTQILVVDDENDLREFHRESLEGAGFVCFTACSGQVALEVFAAEQIDLAIIDVMMPEMAGLDLFAEVKEKYPRTAVLLMGAEERMDIAVSQIKGGALDYLIKPVDKAKLIDAVNEALEKQIEYLENLGDQQHLEELLVHQSKALENKIQEVKALSRMFGIMPVVEPTPGAAGGILKPRPELPETS